MKKILIVEDSDNLLQLYTQILKDDGYEVVSANDGKNGLIVAEREKPDLILLDIMLPNGLNGFDVLETLKKTEILKSVPVIIMTNLDSQEETARKIGASDYFVKTSTLPEQILAKVKALLS